MRRRDSKDSLDRTYTKEWRTWWRQASIRFANRGSQVIVFVIIIFVFVVAVVFIYVAVATVVVVNPLLLLHRCSVLLHRLHKVLCNFLWMLPWLSTMRVVHISHTSAMHVLRTSKKSVFCSVSDSGYSNDRGASTYTAQQTAVLLAVLREVPDYCRSRLYRPMSRASIELRL